jgi:hypothetical protein
MHTTTIKYIYIYIIFKLCYLNTKRKTATTFEILAGHMVSAQPCYARDTKLTAQHCTILALGMLGALGLHDRLDKWLTWGTRGMYTEFWWWILSRNNFMEIQENWKVSQAVKTRNREEKSMIVSREGLRCWIFVFCYHRVRDVSLLANISNYIYTP